MSNFKDKDKVFHPHYGWGIVQRTVRDGIDTTVDFSCGTVSFANNGWDNTFLSATPYTLKKETLNIGQTIYVRHPAEEWHERQFAGYDDEGVWCYSDAPLGSELFWPEYSLTNPLEHG